MPSFVKNLDFPAEDSRPFWLDNSHVLFRGHTATEGPSPGLTHRYYLWDLQGKIPTKDVRFEDVTQICIRDQYWAYTPNVLSARRKVFVKGQEVELPDKFWFNPMSCRASTMKPAWVAASDEGRATVPLLEEHGYIDIGVKGQEMSSNDPWVYHRTGNEQPIPFGLGNREVQSWIQYYPFLDAYLLEATRTASWAPALWLLHPNGTVEQIFNPEGKAWVKQSWSWVVLTKRGVVFGKVTPLGSEVRDSGLYLWENGVLTQLVSGVYSPAAAVSPDGCKLAGVKGRPQRPLPGSELYRLEIIDLCQGGNDVHQS